MRILGVDPGSQATGFGAIDSDGSIHTLVEFGVFRTSPKLSFPDKLRAIHESLNEVVERCRPEEMVVENLFYASNVKSALRLGHVRGVVILAGVLRGIPIREYAPLEVKQAVVGYGRADKEQVQKMVAMLLVMDVAPEPHDAADALAVALCHANQMRFARKVAAAP